MYGGFGPVQEDNFDGPSAHYYQRHAGLGALGVLRPWGAPEGTIQDALGAFLQLGLVGEWRSLRLTSCETSCQADMRPYFVPEAHGGVRLGIGYDFRGVGVRGGVLYAGSPQARIAETVVVPDVQLRFGPRSRAWFELGVGAYDASTALRPGLYAGAAVVIDRDLTIAVHYGWHNALGDLTQLGGRLDLGATYALYPNLHVGGGGSVHSASHLAKGLDLSSFVTEFRGQASFTF
jgi:hypothetical protein